MKKICSLVILAALFSCNNDDSAIESNVQQSSLVSNRNQAALNENFERVEVNSNQTLTSISFMDEQNGVICGSSGEAILTNDGGATWTHLGGPTDMSYTSAFMYDTRNIFGGRVALYKANSRNVMDTLGYLGRYTGAINEIYFSSPSDGFVIKGGGVLKTTDGGLNWSVSLSADHIKDLKIVSPDVFFAYGGATYDGASGGVLYVTFDRGATWTNRRVPSLEIKAADFIDENVGYIVDYVNNVYKTTDSGATWTMIQSPPTRNYGSISSILHISNQQMFMTSYDGYIYKSSDGGENWAIHSQYQTPLYEIYNIGRTLYVVGGNGLVLKN